MLWSSLPLDKPGVLRQPGPVYHSGSHCGALLAQTSTCPKSTSAVKESGEAKRERASCMGNILAHRPFSKGQCVNAHACFLYCYSPSTVSLRHLWLDAWAKHLTDNRATAQAFCNGYLRCVKFYSCVVFGTKCCFQTPRIINSVYCNCIVWLQTYLFKFCVICDSLITLHGPFHTILYGPLNFSHDSSVAMASLHKDTHISQLTYLLSALDLNHTTQLFLPILTKSVFHERNYF